VYTRRRSRDGSYVQETLGEEDAMATAETSSEYRFAVYVLSAAFVGSIIMGLVANFLK
jgi:hypothetical protein